LGGVSRLFTPFLVLAIFVANLSVGIPQFSQNQVTKLF
jgi:hypothetical protein